MGSWGVEGPRLRARPQCPDSRWERVLGGLVTMEMPPSSQGAQTTSSGASSQGGHRCKQTRGGRLVEPPGPGAGWGYLHQSHSFLGLRTGPMTVGFLAGLRHHSSRGIAVHGPGEKGRGQEGAGTGSSRPPPRLLSETSWPSHSSDTGPWGCGGSGWALRDKGASRHPPRGGPRRPILGPRGRGWLKSTPRGWPGARKAPRPVACHHRD